MNNETKPTTPYIIKAKYAHLPMVDTNIKVIVQIVAPVKLVPVQKTFPLYVGQTKTEFEGRLKDKILEEWRSDFAQFDSEQDSGLKDLLNINKVELIECDLLVPKEIDTCDLLAPKE